ncbi:MAG: hypothetical protein Q9160_004579 [Pyrenula sp. 1 TL-2023]
MSRSPSPSAERSPKRVKTSQYEEHRDRQPPAHASRVTDERVEQSQSLPPLPNEAPPLPNERPPEQMKDDGWDPVWDDNAASYYFYNRFTGVSQWENPRVPDVAQPPAPGTEDNGTRSDEGSKSSRRAGGYDPAIHGDYDPEADYAKPHEPSATEAAAAEGVADPTNAYAATGQFNRFTGRWQAADLIPENFNDENKSKRQMNAYFDVDAAANSHDGRSLKAERAGKKLSRQEVKAFKDKRREKKEEKRRAWLRD